MIDPRKVLNEAAKILCERGDDYGTVKDNFTNISLIMARTTNRMLSPYDVAMLMVSLKLARIGNNPGKRDSFIDAINYLAIACELIGAE